MLKKIDHIGVAVYKIEDALPLYTKSLGLKLDHMDAVGGEGVKVAFLPAGETLIELLEPTGEGTAVANFLQKRGEGLHHICFEVEDIDAAIVELQEKGVPLLGDKATQGADGRIIFIHPKAGHGVLIELLEKPR